MDWLCTGVLREWVGLGYGRFGGFHPVVTELSKQCT